MSGRIRHHRTVSVENIKTIKGISMQKNTNTKSDEEARREAKKDILKILDDDDFDSVALRNYLLTNVTISVKNKDDGPQNVKISKACGYGDDDYYTIEPEDTEKWSRCVTRRVTIRVEDGGSLSYITAPGINDFKVDGGEIKRT